MRESLNVVAQYADWTTSGDVEAESDISTDSGAVLRSGLTKLAVYRDEQGNAYKRSGSLPASELHRGVESHGENMGLSLPRIPFR